MKNCPFCGSPLEDEAKFCGECGRQIEEAPLPPVSPESEPTPPPQAPVQAAAQEPEEGPTIVELPDKKQTLTTWQYALLMILYSIPVVGLIFLFIFGAGHPKNISLKRFSVAALILRLVGWILVFSCLIIALVHNGNELTTAFNRLLLNLYY